MHVLTLIKLPKFCFVLFFKFSLCGWFIMAALSLHGDGEKGMDYKFSPNQAGTAAGDTDELAAMDYTPAKKNTPIHN